MDKNFKQTETIINKLLLLSKECSTSAAKQRFVSLSIAVIVWLTSNYTLDLTEEIIVYTQILNTKAYTAESFANIVSFLKIVKSKLSFKS